MKLKELCETVGIEYNNKNPKRSLDKITKCYKIGNVNNKKNDYYIIRELSAEEKREYRTNIKMKEAFKDGICATLSIIEDNKVCGSIKDFYEVFDIVNKNYSWFKYKNITEQKINFLNSQNINMDNLIIYHDFATEIDTMFRRMVKDTLDRLEKELIIYINKRLTFVYVDEHGYKRIKFANENETQSLLEVGRKILDKYKYEVYSDIMYYDKENIKDEISKELGIEYFYNQYEIILNKEYLNKIKIDVSMEVKNKVNELSVKKLSMSKQGVLKEYDIEMLNDCIDTIVKKPTYFP